MSFESELPELSFVERMFFDLVDGKRVVKKVKRIDCSDGVPESLPDDKICLLTHYKANISRGRKDSLRGKDVLRIPSDKGPILLPVDEGVLAGTLLYSYATSLQKTLGA